MDKQPANSVDHSDPTRVGEFVELYTAHYPRLQFYLMALLPSASDAADVLQETSLVLWKKFDSFQSGTNFYAWACKIARLQALKYRDRQARSARVFDLNVLEKLAADAATVESETLETLAALNECMEHLRQSDLLLIRKRYQPQVTVKRMAEEVGRSANSLSKSLGRIRRVLLDCVERRLVRQSRESQRGPA